MACIGWKLSENKAWELQFERWKEWQWFKFELSLTRNCDHPGFRFSLEVVGFFVEFMIYDTRHWSYEKKEFENYMGI